MKKLKKISENSISIVIEKIIEAEPQPFLVICGFAASIRICKACNMNTVEDYIALTLITFFFLCVFYCIVKHITN